MTVFRSYDIIHKNESQIEGANIVTASETAPAMLMALVATFLGCVIGFICGILQTIPYEKTDPLLKRL